NDTFLRKIATPSYLSVMRKLCVSDCIRWSRDIYIQHLTGVQQHGSEVTPAPLTGIIEAPSTSHNGASTPVPMESQTSESANQECVSQLPLTQGEAGPV
ncbi:hypothetical protein TNIN_447671, partial [Trichonephila inaurata madagascariensis]